MQKSGSKITEIKPGRRRLRKVCLSSLGILAQIIVWLSFPLVWEIGAVILFSLLIYLFATRSRWAWLLLVVNPFIIATGLSALGGAYGYFHGSGRFLTRGLPGQEFFNLDPDYRIYREPGGCMFYDSDIFTQAPHNAILASLVEHFGPMAGSYIGPYPGRAEAYSLIRKSQQTISSEKFMEGRIALVGKKFQLQEDAVLEALGLLLPSHYPRWESLKMGLERGGPLGHQLLREVIAEELSHHPFKLYVVEGQCLIVADSVEGPRQPVVLIDLASSKVFAHYATDDP